MNHDEMLFLSTEATELEAILGELPEDRVIDRIGLESRLRQVKEELAQANPYEEIGCFECDTGRLQHVLLDYTTSHRSRGKMVLEAVPMMRCPDCGDTVTGDAGNRMIDAWLDGELKAIRPEEIQAFLDKYHLTLKEAAEITGLGEISLSRWLAGRSRPPESASNFLRVLLAEESAFEFLRKLA